MARVELPETFYMLSGSKDKFAEFEEAAWNDFVHKFLKNPEYESYGFHAYFPVYILTNISSSSSVGQSPSSGNYVERGTITGKQATGILMVSQTTINFFARRDISLKFPFRNPVGKENIALFFLNTWVGGKTALLGYHEKDYHYEIPISNLNLYIVDHKEFGRLIVFEHPDYPTHYVNSFFTNLVSKIVDLIRSLQEQNLLDLRVDEELSASEKSPEERLKMLYSLFEAGALNEEEYETAKKRIIDSI